MNIDKMVLVFAGSMVLISLSVAYLLSPKGMILGALVGVMLVQSGFTGFCPVANLLKKLGFKTGKAFN